MRFCDLGLITYPEGLAQMEESRARVEAGGEDEVLLLEHQPVVTLGKRGGEWDRARLERMGTPVIQTDRGGLATWHGPGQLVAYPIVDLRRRGRAVPEFVALLGEAMVRVCEAAGVQGIDYDPDRPGVYVNGQKLGAIGLHIQRGVTTHGLALNVSCALDGFRAIVPCGLTNV
ncbi:MAG: lipoyl(octanoyl) transferase LipB, partial [Myxococcota bacterium]|nr:lipoyl(octanoyl) transferase LipB [Myxococcota bacterium]